MDCIPYSPMLMRFGRTAIGSFHSRLGSHRLRPVGNFIHLGSRKQNSSVSPQIRATCFSFKAKNGAKQTFSSLAASPQRHPCGMAPKKEKNRSDPKKSVNHLESITEVPRYDTTGNTKSIHSARPSSHFFPLSEGAVYVAPPFPSL